MAMNPRLLRPLARRQAPSAIHPEALDWSARVASNGGSTSPATLSAVSQFCGAIDASSGLREAILRCNLFCGDNLLACLTPLYRSSSLSASVLGNATDTNNNFVSADYEEDAGLLGDATSKVLRTGFTPALFSSTSSIHLSSSGTGLENTGDAFFVASYDPNFGEPGLISLDIYADYASGRGFRGGAASFGSFPVVSPSGGSEQHFIGSLTAAGGAKLYRDGTLVDTIAEPPSIPEPIEVEFAVFALPLFGGFSLYTAARLRMYSIGDGLTATQATAFSAAVLAFNTALGRA